MSNSVDGSHLQQNHKRLISPNFFSGQPLSDVASPDREKAVIEACTQWKLGLAADAPPQTYKVQPDGLCFFGSTNAESSAAFVEAVSSIEPTLPLVVVVTSFGGEVNAGMAMAEALVPRSTTVVAQKSCISSCANYLFLAGDRRVVTADALLGYHGGVVQEDDETEHSELVEQFGADRARAIQRDSRTQTYAAIARQDAFLTSVGADVDFFRWMASATSLPEARQLALCPVSTAKVMIFSSDVMEEHGILINDNQGPQGDKAVEDFLVDRGSVGFACYWD